MDRKNLVFIFLLTAILFGVNSYFASQDTIEKSEDSMVTESLTNAPPEIKARVAHISSLPLAELYKDKEGKEMLQFSLNFGASYVATTVEKLPSIAYARSGKKIIPITLVFSNDSGLAYYTSDVEQHLTTAYLPQVGTVDLQMVALEGSTPVVKIGQYHDGKLHFPGKPTEADSIALYKGENGFLPIGIYSAEQNKFHILSQFSELDKMLTYQPLKPNESLDKREQFYVLENETQQLVFSTLGGSLAEINLPFKSKKNKVSVVREINFDRQIEKKYTPNSHFPLNNYYTIDATGRQVKAQPKVGGYYPLLRRDLINNKKKEISDIASRFYALNLINEDDDFADTIYKVVEFSKSHIVFQSTQNSRKVTKTFRLPSSAEQTPYCLEAQIRIDGDARGFWVNSGVPEVELISKNFTPALKYRTLKGNKFAIEKLSLPKTSSTLSGIDPLWVANTNGFFGIIMDPISRVKSGVKALNLPGDVVPSRISLIDAKYDLYPATKYPGYELMLPLKKSSKEVNLRIFAGPLENTLLKKLDANFFAATGTNPDYKGAQSIHGFFSFISEPFARFLYLILNAFYSMTHSWGFSIILLTIILRILMFPLNQWSFKSTARMQLLAPKQAKLQEKFKNDPKRLQVEMFKLYKENKANPFSSCLPLLIQMPFLIGMFDLLKSTFGLRGAAFIPGWIDNLAAPDVLFSWNYPIFFFGTSFHLLPFILGGIMFLQQKMAAASRKDAPMSDQQKQQQKMGMIMTIGFTFLFYSFPSGLNIYWISSSLLGILQQWYTNRSVKSKGLPVVEVQGNPKKGKFR